VNADENDAVEQTGAGEPATNADKSGADEPTAATAAEDAWAEEFEVSLEVTPDRLAVLLTCRIPEDDLPILARRIRKELVALGAEGAWEHDELAAWLRDRGNENPDLVDAILVSGTPATPPVDGKIEWEGDFFSEGFVIDEESGAIDYRKRVAQRTVHANQPLARMTPPREGVEGRDVFGKRLAVQRPKTPHVRLGRNVRLKEEEACYYATADGWIHWEPKDRRSPGAGGLLAVDEVLTIRGSVNLATGDISHPGALVIEKDVEEGATIEVGGDIEVKGVVEPANIVAMLP